MVLEVFLDWKVFFIFGVILNVVCRIFGDNVFYIDVFFVKWVKMGLLKYLEKFV